MNATINTIKMILSTLKKSPELAHSLSDTANIIEDVGLDSLEMLQFMLEVEEKLAVVIDFDQLEYEHLHSITRLATLLRTMPAAAVDSERE